ncbi:hypothetical protein KL86CLO1_12504 [uncultured Eubacteriales bacterium]|uniref:Uncharacterized protein n=1 Tax=uncultured Eubacteriales bacterium TaxID=172733 RepID=A0A212KB41_9FIRM|nr:hypothetical protein KL86CLO1_12504 [uncultured Eubacteriales bacterium]
MPKGRIRTACAQTRAGESLIQNLSWLSTDFTKFLLLYDSGRVSQKHKIIFANCNMRYTL